MTVVAQMGGIDGGGDARRRGPEGDQILLFVRFE